eukprot:Em0005g856a
MGQNTSRIQPRDCRYNDQFLIIGNPTEKVEFDTTQSHLVGFAIDYQSNGKCKSLGRPVVNDAKLVSNTFVEIGAVPEGNTTIHVASENLKELGHGVELGGDQWGLVPSDFDRSERTCITASVLNDWLTEANCKAKHVLFALDCCHAGGIGRALNTANLQLHRSLFVVSACTANETSYDAPTLGHSPFSYFFADAMRKKTSDPRKLPLCNIMTECRAQEVNDDETDGVPKLGRFEYLTKHFDRKAPMVPLHAKTKRWLKTIVESIIILHDRGLLKAEVLNTAVCSVMMSIASYELAFQRDAVSQPNAFIIAFLEMVSLFDFPDVEVTIDHFIKEGWRYYDNVLQKNAVNDASIKALLNTIHQESKDGSCSNTG